MTFVASTEEVDRHGDVVSVAGWKLDAYRKNPVFLWAHDYARPAIGRSTQVWTTARETGGEAGRGPALLTPALLVKVEFAPTGSPKRWLPCTGAVTRRGCRWGSARCGSRNVGTPDRQVPRHQVHRAGAAGGERRPCAGE